MSQKEITLHLDEQLQDVLDRRARTEGKSVDELATSISRAGCGDPQPMREARERALAGLAGTWTREQADEFDRILAEMDGMAWGLDPALSRALHDRAKREDKAMGSRIAELLREAMGVSGESEA